MLQNNIKIYQLEGIKMNSDKAALRVVFQNNMEQILTRIKIGTPDKSRCVYATALWDTGCSVTSISSRLINKLELAPSGTTEILTTYGKQISSMYDILMYIEEQDHYIRNRNTPSYPFMKGQKHDLLIGMDVIKLGDFNIIRKDDTFEFIFSVT